MKEILIDAHNGTINISQDCIAAIGSPKIIVFLLNREKFTLGIYACKGQVYSPTSNKIRYSLDLPEPRDGYYTIDCEVFANHLYYICGWQKFSSYKIADLIYNNNQLMFFNLKGCCAISKTGPQGYKTATEGT